MAPGWVYKIINDCRVLLRGKKWELDCAKHEAKKMLSKLKNIELDFLLVNFTKGNSKKYLVKRGLIKNDINSDEGFLEIFDYRKDKKLIINLANVETIEIENIT